MGGGSVVGREERVCVFGLCSGGFGVVGKVGRFGMAVKERLNGNG